MNEMSSTPPPVSAETLAAFRQQAEAITRSTVQKALAFPEQVAHHGEKAAELLFTGLQFTTKGLESAMAFHTMQLIADQMDWARQRLPHDGVTGQHILHHLTLYRDSVTEILSPEQAVEVNKYVDWMITYQQNLINSQ